MNLRIGHGYDVHGFIPGDHIMLGGVRIPHYYSFAAHSDGDVLIHAVCDALLGALGEGDIGHWFPDSDSAYKNIDSRLLLKQVVQRADSLGYKLSNLDVTLIAQAPKMADYIPQMKGILAVDLNVCESCINIKATTTEKLGYIGREEGIACHAILLLLKR